MKNGNALHAFVQDTLGYLEDKQVVSYYGQGFPSEMDAQLDEIIERFMGLSSEQRESFQAALSQSQRSLFGIYGHRAATLAVRNDDRVQLLRGLVGTAVSNFVIPKQRRIEVGLAVYHHCARKLGMNPADLFAQAADYAMPDLAYQLAAFGQQPGITLRKYGWFERKTRYGVEYHFSVG